LGSPQSHRCSSQQPSRRSARAIIRIYSLSGVLVAAIAHNDPTGGGAATWDLKSRSGKYVASGVYFYHIETVDGHSKVGRFTLVMERP
jgi:hypothetical protein